MKTFIIILLVSSAVFFIIVFNLIVDPAMLFKDKDYERNTAEALSSGRAITDLQDAGFDDRNFEKFMIQSLKNKKDIAVFGSGRVELISSELFPGKTLLNNGLSRASLEDLICLYEIYREKSMLPSTIIIGVDPWDFNRNNLLTRWRQFGEYYSKFNDAGPHGPFNFNRMVQALIPYRFQQLVSFSYFRMGIRSLKSMKFHWFPEKQGVTLTSQRLNENRTLLPDGSWTWARSEREADPAKVQEQVQQQNAAHTGLYLSKFAELDKGLKQKFISLIQAMKSDGVRVVLFLAPYHPDAYDYYIHSDDLKIITDVENFIRKTSETYGLTVVGTYDPHSLAIPGSSFRNDVYLKDDTELKRIFS